MNKKINGRQLLVLMGSPTAEHEISIISGKNIVKAAANCPPVSGVTVVVISKNRRWYKLHDVAALESIKGVAEEMEPAVAEECLLWQNKIISLVNGQVLAEIDVVFPVLHGPYGENGSVQGLLEVADLPYIGERVLSSAIGMNKHFFKQIAAKNNIPVLPFVALKEMSDADYEETCAALNSRVVIVKNAEQGSSIGVFKAATAAEFVEACQAAFSYGEMVIVEPFVAERRELECAVLAKGDEFIISDIAEISLNRGEIYSYTAKYLDASIANLSLPAVLEAAVREQLVEIVTRVCEVYKLSSMARIDLFLTQEGQLVVNEINTIPGFTAISMYPQLFKEMGISVEKLLELLIEQACWQFAKRKKYSDDIQETISLQQGSTAAAEI